MTVLLTQPASVLEKFTWSWKGHSIQYTVIGTGKPLLMVHGFGASLGHWRKNIPVLAAGGYRVFAIDLLGFGGSDKPAIDYTLDLWEELLFDFWKAHINEPTVFVGNSIGGLLCLIMLANHPETAEGGVLLNSAGGMSHRPNELNIPLRLIMAAFTYLVKSPWFGPLVFNQIRQKHRIRRTLAQVYRNQEAITDELVDMLYAPSCDEGAQKVFASVLTAPPGPSPAELLPKVKVPLLVLWGDADPWTPVAGAKIYEQLVESQPVKVVAIPNTGHCPHDDRPEIVNPLILEWLEELFNAPTTSLLHFD
ncbi:alpha/beta fold hydrolase [Leptothermofonsia sp. ETS-13]|uniref:alpha/beta fold hydrolase n=1 Tax=Leptothermofonsia sp. ETS-13 TaxID=3035696 RepID=UPI003B9F8846